MRGTMGLVFRSGGGSVRAPLSLPGKRDGRMGAVLPVGSVPLTVSLGLRLLPGSISECSGQAGGERGSCGGRRPWCGGRGAPSAWARPGGWGGAASPRAMARRDRRFCVGPVSAVVFPGALCAWREEKDHPCVALGTVKRTTVGVGK